MSVILWPPPVEEVARMSMSISVAYGIATVSKDGEEIYSEPRDAMEYGDFWTVQTAENEARKDPDHEWIIDLQGPLRGRTYKRMGNDNWVLIAINEGFAQE